MKLVISVTHQLPRWFALEVEVAVISVPNLFTDTGMAWATKSLASLIVCNECRPESVFIVDTTNPRRKGFDPRAYTLAAQLAEQLVIPVVLVWHERSGTKQQEFLHRSAVDVATCVQTLAVVRSAQLGIALSVELAAHIIVCGQCAQVFAANKRIPTYEQAQPPVLTFNGWDLELL